MARLGEDQGAGEGPFVPTPSGLDMPITSAQAIKQLLITGLYQSRNEGLKVTKWHLK